MSTTLSIPVASVIESNTFSKEVMNQKPDRELTAYERLLVGDWTLLDSYEERLDGEVVRSRGNAPTGMLVYSPNRRMMVQVISSDPWRLETAYFGLFEINEAEHSVLHHMEGSMVASEAGATRKRYWELTGNTLQLTTPPFEINGEMRIRRINWRRGGTTREFTFKI